MTSRYLTTPLRSLDQLHADLEGQIASLELALAHADDEHTARIEDALDELRNRLDVLEEEIGWRSQAEECRNSPIVL